MFWSTVVVAALVLLQSRVLQQSITGKAADNTLGTAWSDVFQQLQ